MKWVLNCAHIWYQMCKEHVSLSPSSGLVCVACSLYIAAVSPENPFLLTLCAIPSGVIHSEVFCMEMWCVFRFQFWKCIYVNSDY